jgi:molybdate/tungstate transport system substrate-binding protein
VDAIRRLVQRILVGSRSTTCGRYWTRLTQVLRRMAIPIVVAPSMAPALVAHAADTVDVLYAASLVNVMERGIGPAFDKVGGDHFQGHPGGSNDIAYQIKSMLRPGDVFISAVPEVNDRLMGPQNGSWVSWYITFAASPLVLGFNPTGRFAEDFKSKPWYQVLAEPGIRIGRTNPGLDPKGALTLTLMERAEAYYKSPGLSRRVLGAANNPAQVLPEETLVDRLQSGQLDVGFFYSTETSSAGIPEYRLPAEIAPKAVYTVTILRDAPNSSGGVRFIAYLLGASGKTLMTQHGLDFDKPELVGTLAAVPPELRSFVDQSK